MKLARISSRQFTWLIFSVLISTSAIILPGIIIANAKQSAWLAILFATLVVTGGILLNLALVEQFPGQTIAQFSQTLLGTWLGKCVGIFYALTFLYLAAACIGIVSQLIKIAIMQETPLWPFVFGFILLVVYSAWLGIEPIARANDLILPLILLVTVVLLLLAAPGGKLYQAWPVWQLNYSGILQGSMPSMSCLGEVFFILILAPAINKPEQLKPATLKGLLLSGLALMLITQTVLLILGSYRASIYFFPFLKVSAELHVLDFFERFDPFVITAVFIINSIKMSVLIYCFAISTVQTLNLKSNRIVLLSSVIFIPLIDFAPKSFAEALQIWVNLIAFKILIPIAFIILPGLLFIVAKVKKHYV